MTEFPKKLQEFDDAVRFVKKNNVSIPSKVILALDTAQTDLELGITGNFIYVLDTADNTNEISVKFNQKDGDGVPLKRQQGIRTPFDRVFITHSAQAAGTVTLIFGTGAPDIMGVVDNRAVISGDLEAIRDELRGDTAADEEGDRIALSAEGEIMAANTTRKSFGIHNPTGNGILYLRFGSTVVTTTNYAVALEAGQTFIGDDYRGIVRGLMATSGQFAHFWEF